MRIDVIPSRLIILSLMFVIACMLLYWLDKGKYSAPAATETVAVEPVAEVETIKPRKGEIKEILTAYGLVRPLPDKLKTISASYTSQVDIIQVKQGQLVQQGQLLLTLKPVADALLKLQQAQTELNASLRENQLLHERMQLKLTTKQNLYSSRLRVEQAKIMLNNLRGRGIGKQQQIKAEHSGIVYQVNVRQGQIVSAASPLLQLADQNQWGVRLGIDPEDFNRLQVGQPVLITPVNAAVPEQIKGRIEIITHRIDPVTRLLNVFVRLESNNNLLINDFVKGRIIVAAHNAFLVPRQAVLSANGEYNLYTIENSRAVKHKVQVGLQNNTRVEVLMPGLQERNDVVVLGNYELEPGMAVSAKPHHPVSREALP